VAAALAGPAIPPDSGDGLPAFDIARIEPTGEAVIAGRAIPGATVELLRIARSRSRPQLAAAVATALPGGGSPSTMVLPKIATTTVSRGDSLWRLSRLRYGVGTRYAVIYKANREQIRNPNLIHPGQIFVLPAR
jgi:nucleoid-associated protein YgaU